MERQLGFSALQCRHYAAAPSVCACFFRTIFCAFAPCPAANGAWRFRVPRRRIRAMRGPGESYSDVILRLAKGTTPMKRAKR